MFGLRKKNAKANHPPYIGTLPGISKQFGTGPYNSARLVGHAGADVKGSAGGKAGPLYDVQFLPEGISVKRVFSRKGINKWMAHRQGTKTEYYSPTLDGALSELFKNHVESLSKYNTNAKLAGGTRS